MASRVPRLPVHRGASVSGGRRSGVDHARADQWARDVVGVPGPSLATAGSIHTHPAKEGHAVRATRLVRAIAVAVCLWPLTLPASDITEATLTPYFSPHGGCTAAIVDALGHAQHTVYVQAYSFTSAPIAKALVDAWKRGVKVEVVLDKSQRSERYSSADFVANAGIPTRIDAKHAIAHNKIMIIDGGTVLTGSFNFTKGAEEQNAENLLVIRSKELADVYLRNWQAHAEHSEPYAGRGR